jgi:phosphate transport system substrate-binding protein
MKTKLLYLLPLIIVLTCCKQVTTREERSLPNHPGPIKITGAFALSPLTQVWITEFQKTHPYVKFEVEANGSGRGLNDITAGKTDLAMISSDLPSGVDTFLWVIPVARLACVPVVSAKNPYLKDILKAGMKKEDLSGLFSGNNPKTWGELYGKSASGKTNAYLRSDSSGATDVLAKFLWLQPNEIKGTPVNGEDKMLEAVKNDPLAIGYCNFIYAIDVKTHAFNPDLVILPLDLNQNGKLDQKENFYDNVDNLQRAMWLGRYPCVLTRNLYLVSNGKPATKEMVEFLIWVLTDGQKLVPSQGYIELHSFEIPPRLYALKN